MQAKTGVRSLIVLAAILMIAAATLLHVGRVLTTRYPIIAVITALWEAPQSPGR